MTPVPPDTVPPVSELLTRAERWVLDRPGAVACQVGGRRPEAVSYAETARSVRETTAALAHAGVRHGTRTVVLVFPGVELGVLALSLLRLGAVPVMVDPGLPYSAVRRCLDRAAPEVFIGVPRAQLARLALGWGRRSSRVTITVGPRRLWPGRTLASLRSAANRQPSHPPKTTAANPPPSASSTPPSAGSAPHSASSAPPSAGSAPHAAGSALSGEVVRWRRPAPDDLALIAYTSGSTGPPKGVPLRHRQLTAQLDLLSGLEAVRPGTPVLSTFIPFALGAAALGATAVLPDLDPRRPIRASPAALVADVQRYGVTSVFAAPALLDRLARHCVARGVVLGTV